MADKKSRKSNGLDYCETILDAIGQTPLVKLQRIPKDYGLECEIYVKCEFMNPGGSIKDRIAYSMVKDARDSGRATNVTRFVEPTSGNTGIGVALVSTVYGHPCTIVTTDKSSDVKINTTLDLGAEVIQAPASAQHGDPENWISVTKQILEKDPHAICLDQFSNGVNPQTHYETTAEEILESLKDINMIVIGAGTGGTLTGVGKKVKEVIPTCAVVAVDPVGSNMFEGDEFKPYLVEGIGSDFIPKVLDKSVVNMVVYPTDKESFNMARELMKKEGLMCGGSSGAAMVSAIRAATELRLSAGDRVVVILPDGIRNYMDKFVTDQWMEAYLFKDVPERHYKWWNCSIRELDIDTGVPIISEKMTCSDAVQVLGPDNDVAVVINEEGYLKGLVTRNSLRFWATNPRRSDETFDFCDPVSRHMEKTYYKIVDNKDQPTVGLASRILDLTSVVVMVEEIKENEIVLGALILYIYKGSAHLETTDIDLEFEALLQKCNRLRGAAAEYSSVLDF